MSRVRFVHCTPNAEKLIVEMARVSNPKNQENHSTGPKLLRHLLLAEHWSPFEMATMAVRIDTTRAVAPQILRHGKGFSFQEFSQRYSSVHELPEIEIPELRRQDHKRKQCSYDDLSPELVEQLQARIEQHFEDAVDLYDELLKHDVAKECARAVLPLATPSRLYMHGPLRSWMHYISVRAAWDSQKEHREIALGCYEIFREQFPLVSEAMWPNGDPGS